MTIVEKAKAQLTEDGITVSANRNLTKTVYIVVKDMELQLSEFEIRFQAEQYDSTEH